MADKIKAVKAEETTAGGGLSDQRTIAAKKSSRHGTEIYARQSRNDGSFHGKSHIEFVHAVVTHENRLST